MSQMKTLPEATMQVASTVVLKRSVCDELSPVHQWFLKWGERHM